MSDEPCCMASAHDQKCGCRRKKRSFPDAADGRPSTPMAVELWAAGCDTDTSHFVARQLAFNRIAMIRHNDDGTVTYIGAEEWPVPAIEPVDPATIRAEALREACKAAIEAYDKANPFRTADCHGDGCDCFRCCMDVMRALIDKEQDK